MSVYGSCSSGNRTQLSSVLMAVAREVSNLAYSVTDMASSSCYGIPGSALENPSVRELADTLDVVGYGSADLVSRSAYGMAWAYIRGGDLIKEALQSGNYSDIAKRLFPNPDRRKGFRFKNTYMCDHRSGWNYVNYLLQKEFSSPTGPLFIDFAERVWGWDLESGDKTVTYLDREYTVPASELRTLDNTTVAPVAEMGVVVAWNGSEWSEVRGVRPEDIAYLPMPGTVNEDFVAVFHNPPNMPHWFGEESGPEAILSKPQFQDSLDRCKGILVFSSYLGDWLRKRLPHHVPVSVVMHPTEAVPRIHHWCPRKFSASLTLVQLGWWLRRLQTVFSINSHGLRKMWLHGGDKALELLEREFEENPCSSHATAAEMMAASDVQVKRLDNHNYDLVLRESVVLIDLYDSSCNNAIIECVARRTPFFVNRIPAVVEYVGRDYPLLFDDVSEVEHVLEQISWGDLKPLVDARDYLHELDGAGYYRGDAFVRSIKNCIAAW